MLMSRLREGRANTARGAAHFLRETVGRVRHAGAKGQLTVRADSGFYTHGVVSVCRKMDVRFSITIRQHKSLRHLIEAIPETDWTPIPYWMDGAADVAETTYTPFESEAHAEAYTSKTCSWNGEIVAKLGGRRWIQSSDDFRVERDINGARGIFLRALGDTPSLMQSACIATGVVKVG